MDEGKRAEVVALIEEGVGGGLLRLLGGCGRGEEAGGEQECGGGGSGGVRRGHAVLRGWALVRVVSGGRGAVPEEIVARSDEGGVRKAVQVFGVCVLLSAHPFFAMSVVCGGRTVWVSEWQVWRAGVGC